jgi:transposase-like protein
MTMTNAALNERAQNGTVPDDNPAARPKRRQFSADYKLSILEEYGRITDPGGKGALLRREGLYSSHIVEWQRAREVGALGGLARKHRRKRNEAERELEALRRKNVKLEDQLARHRVALEAQGKASELLAQLLAESTPETTQQPEQGPKR